MVPFTLKHIDHVVLRVADMERSLNFYTRALGCSIDRRRDDLGMVHLRVGSAMLDLVDIHGRIGREGGAAPGADAHNMDHVCLRVEPFDADAIRTHLQALGITTEAAVMRYGAQGSGLSLYCHDPDGNRIELKGPALE